MGMPSARRTELAWVPMIVGLVVPLMVLVISKLRHLFHCHRHPKASLVDVLISRSLDGYAISSEDQTSPGVQQRCESKAATPEMLLRMPGASSEIVVEGTTGSASSSSTPMGRLIRYCRILCWWVHRDWRDDSGVLWFLLARINSSQSYGSVYGSWGTRRQRTTYHIHESQLGGSARPLGLRWGYMTRH
ncbi:hypothetical protein IW262DRAFT_1417447 [Armillaria fumosa]|nr:hypothetical protein IW262DRAFT_1417447 [Armillaria fumosa]